MIILLFQSLLVVVSSEFNKRTDYVSIWNEIDSIINTETRNINSRVLLVFRHHIWLNIISEFRFELIIGIWLDSSNRCERKSASWYIKWIELYSNLKQSVKEIISFETSPLVDCMLFEQWDWTMCVRLVIWTCVHFLSLICVRFSLMCVIAWCFCSIILSIEIDLNCSLHGI